eukprot:6684165-Heterocapsa_arctica.AAC.1
MSTFGTGLRLTALPAAVATVSGLNAPYPCPPCRLGSESLTFDCPPYRLGSVAPALQARV